MMRYITDTDDMNNVLNNQPDNKLLVVCYTASWCGPCKTIMSPLCEKVAGSNPNITIVKVDVDDCENGFNERNKLYAYITFIKNKIYYTIRRR